MKDVYKDLELELKEREEKIASLESENRKLKDIIIENDLEEEIDEDLRESFSEKRKLIKEMFRRISKFN